MARQGKNVKSDLIRSRVITGDHFLGKQPIHNLRRDRDITRETILW